MKPNVRLGCKRDARKALDGKLDFVGSGAYRNVYCDARKAVVYKVDQFNQHGEPYPGNRDEAAAFEDIGEDDAIAPTTTWKIGDRLVICQPMYQSPWAWPGDVSSEERRIYDAARNLGVGDMHDGNWMMDANGVGWITDFQM